MKKYNVCVQSTDDNGYVGDFLQDSETGKTSSPVFNDLCALYDWCRKNDFLPYDWGYVSADELGISLVKV